MSIDDISCFIVKSRIRGQHNWSGKEFSDLPAKMYFTYQDAVDAIACYWYGGYNNDGADGRVIQIVPLTEDGKNALLKVGVIRL